LIYFIDPKTGEFRDKAFLLDEQFKINTLVDSRFDQQTNLIVLRNQACQFFWIKNIGSGLAVNKFTASEHLEDLVGTDNDLISDYIIIP